MHRLCFNFTLVGCKSRIMHLYVQAVPTLQDMQDNVYATLTTQTCCSTKYVKVINSTSQCRENKLVQGCFFVSKSLPWTLLQMAHVCKDVDVDLCRDSKEHRSGGKLFATFMDALWEVLLCWKPARFLHKLQILTPILVSLSENNSIVGIIGFGCPTLVRYFSCAEKLAWCHHGF